jgi:peptidoglycan lytic transglycosylase
MHTVSKAPGRVAVFSLLVTTLVVLLCDSSSTFASRRHRHRARRQAVRPSIPANGTLIGRATWYGPGFHGHRTASGEPFNRHALTLASRGLPMHTMVRVTNLQNGRSAIARVNDRGPFGHGAIADLSEALARRVGMGGAARVKIQVLGWKSNY